jgi:hypothetical protein
MFETQSRKVKDMPVQIELLKGAAILGEIEEFGSFAYETRRYLCRSLHVAFARQSPGADWARSEAEADNIRAQRQLYEILPTLRSAISQCDRCADPDSFLLPLIAATAFDLSSGRIATFSQYRFLYERLLGAAARPWLASAFAAAASLPYVDADERRCLLASLMDAVSERWSSTEPKFFPEWLED